VAKHTHEYNMMTGLTYCGKPWDESYQGTTSYNCPKCIAATDAEEAETQAEDDAANGGTGNESAAVVATTIRDVMPEVAAEPVWLETNQRNLHEAIGTAMIATANHDAYIAWYSAMQLKYGWHANLWDGEKMMDEAKVLVKDCGRTWKECKAEYDKRKAEMIRRKERRK
jgi:uncharacterized Zn ribbon protein